MKKTSLLSTVGLMLAFAGAAQAVTLYWSDEIEGYPLKFLKESSPTYTGYFDLTDDGFDPLTMTITSAYARFAFADDSSYDADEYVDIFINNSLLIDDQEVNGSHPYNSYAWYSETLNASMLLALQDDGQISFKVQLLNTSGTNDTYLKVAQLFAEGTENVVVPPPPPPPVHGVSDETNTALLLAAAAFAGAALRRRNRR